MVSMPKSKNSQDRISKVILQDVTVLAAGQTVELRDNKPVTFTTVTLALDPGRAAAHNNLGNLLKEVGRIDEAVAAYRRALDADPAFATAASNMLVAQKLIDDRTPVEVLETHRAWARAIERNVPPRRPVRPGIDVADRPGFGVELNEAVIRARSLPL